MTGATRRIRAATPEKRRRLLDATEQIMVKDGYAAVTSRRVEAEAGVKLHYHFPTLDDLFVAVVRRHGEATLTRLSEALRSPEPLRAWWELAADRRGNTLLVELTAAANHRPAIRAEVARYARELRRLQIEALTGILDDYGIDHGVFPPALVAAAVQGTAFAISYDRAAGFDTAHEEALAGVEALLGRLEARRSARSSRRRRSGGDGPARDAPGRRRGVARGRPAG